MNRFSYTEINEPVKIAVIFEKSDILPRWFVWKNRKYIVKDITYTWIDTSRGRKYICFSVWDGLNLYEISMDSKYFTWRLEKVYIE